MKSVMHTVIVPLAVLLAFPAGVVLAQGKMSRDEYEREVSRVTALRNGEQSQSAQLDAQIAALRNQSVKLDGECDICLNDLYALVGADAKKAAAFGADIAAAEKSAGDLLRLSDADLLSRSADVHSLSANVKGLWKNKLSLIPDFYDRLTSLNGDVAKLEKAIGGGGAKTYTVGAWSTTHDCLWTISSKKTIYDSPWMWPKIWQGNRDRIKDPDLIYPGQKLSIPPAGALTALEKKAEMSYYDAKESHQKRKPLATK